MITRFVKMTFVPEKANEFLSIFNDAKDKIRDFKGCSHLELLQDKTNKNIFFTYSIWETEEHLNAYRRSELFEVTWEKTKKIFLDKPEAWTLATPS